MLVQVVAGCFLRYEEVLEVSWKIFEIHLPKSFNLFSSKNNVFLITNLYFLSCYSLIFENHFRTIVQGEKMAASYITSRICVINYTEGPDSLQEMRSIIESRHNLANIAIYNLSSTPFPQHRFPNATVSWLRILDCFCFINLY
jgi:hypothetical protein